MTEQTSESFSPTPQTEAPTVKIGRLDTLKSVRREMSRLYVALRNKVVTPKEAGTAAYILTAITKTLEVEFIERRVRALEQHAGLDKNGRSVRPPQTFEHDRVVAAMPPALRKPS